MKRKLISFSLAILLMLGLHSFFVIESNAFCTPDSYISQESLYKDSMLSLLYPYISQAITNYYGFPKQFDLSDGKILSIKKPYPEVFRYDITVQVQTFTGPHNPPRGIETITISTSPEGTRIINFVHKPDRDVL